MNLNVVRRTAEKWPHATRIVTEQLAARRQRTAELLAGGQTITAVAKAVGVS
jgi:hypothetical protein